MTWSLVDRLIERDFPGVPAITTDSLAVRIAAEPAVVLLDVRPEGEFAVSHLDGARRVDPEAPLPGWVEALPRDTPIVAYCSVGYRSARLVEALREAGFDGASNLDGSIFRWANEGRPVVRDGRPVRDVHPYDRLWGRLLDPELRTRVPRD